MPTYADPNACDSCSNENHGPLCVYICPGDLMVLDERTDLAFNQEPDMCSECYACVKLCPREALHVRGYADFIPLGGSVQPHQTEDGICWNVRFRDGREFEFTYQSRTKPAGSIVLWEGFTEDEQADLRSQYLAGESLWLGVDSLSSPVANSLGHSDEQSDERLS